MRVNYRNHRKIVVIDGKVGFVGGFNVGRNILEKTKSLVIGEIHICVLKVQRSHLLQ